MKRTKGIMRINRLKRTEKTMAHLASRSSAIGANTAGSTEHHLDQPFPAALARYAL
jgi:hypothetical protein